MLTARPSRAAAATASTNSANTKYVGAASSPTHSAGLSSTNRTNPNLSPARRCSAETPTIQ